MTTSHGCGCGGNGSSPVRYNADIVEGLKTKGQSAISTRMAGGSAQTSLLSVGNSLALEVLSTDENDKSSLVIFQKVGIFSALEIKLKKFDINYPKADIEIYFKIDPLDGGIFKLEGTLIISCPDIANPSGCSTSISWGGTQKDVQALINWDCLKNCAPQCISCGGNWQCWLGCAGGCIIQCL